MGCAVCVEQDLWGFTVFLLNFAINLKPSNCSQKSPFKSKKKNPHVRSVIRIWDLDNVILADVQQQMPERRLNAKAQEFQRRGLRKKQSLELFGWS